MDQREIDDGSVQDPVENWMRGSSVTLQCNDNNVFEVNFLDAYQGMINGVHPGASVGTGTVSINGNAYNYEKWWIRVRPAVELEHGTYDIEWTAGFNGIPEATSARIRNSGQYQGEYLPLYASGAMSPGTVNVETNARF